MKKLYLILLIGLLFSACSKDKCRDADRGIYIYPEKPSGITFLEALEFYKIPENVLRCISTDALVQTCISYPEIGLIWTRNSLQQGFDFVKSNCNGFAELLNRSDGYSEIVNDYKQLDINRNWNSYSVLENGHYIVNIIYHELFLAQNEILLNLSKDQKSELFKLVLDNQKSKFDLVEFYGITGMTSSLAILARIMYNDQYQPFMEEYKINEPLRIETTIILILDSDLVEIITNLSDEYLKTLKK